MFSLFGRKRADVFEQRRKRQDVWKHIRRIVDGTADRLQIADENDTRTSTRERRCLPALVVPLTVDGPLTSRALYGITHEFGDHGVSILLPAEPDCDEIVCAFGDEPVFFLGRVRHRVPFGGGYWRTGVELTELYESSDAELLARLAESLSPAAE